MKIHLIGIGGIGVSALAQYYLAKGHEVSGSDLVTSEITDFLKRPINGHPGVKFFVPENPDLVIYSPAVKKDNPELKKFLDLKIKCQSYPEALGDLTKEYYTIAVAGAHGKSTTTAMVALVLVEAGLDPTVIVGTKLKEFGDSNFRQGESKYLIIEACEYDSSFLNYSPKIIAITNIDKEHLDYFKTFANVKKAFKDFIACLAEAKSEGGCDSSFLIYNKDDKNIPLPKKPKFEVVGYSTKQKDALKIKNILQVPGSHNISNALASLEISRILGIPDEVTFKALSAFTGTWRRFEIKQGSVEGKKITVVSDYAHHPSEILATLKAAREKYPSQKIWCIFQPHQHQRTYYLFNDFVKIFSRVVGSRKAGRIDKIIITDIYDVAGRENKKINEEVSSEKLVKKINKTSVIYMPLYNLEEYIMAQIKSGEVLIIMGAGDIYKLADKF